MYFVRCRYTFFLLDFQNKRQTNTVHRCRILQRKHLDLFFQITYKLKFDISIILRIKHLMSTLNKTNLMKNDRKWVISEEEKRISSTICLQMPLRLILCSLMQWHFYMTFQSHQRLNSQNKKSQTYNVKHNNVWELLVALCMINLPIYSHFFLVTFKVFHLCSSDIDFHSSSLRLSLLPAFTFLSLCICCLFSLSSFPYAFFSLPIPSFSQVYRAKIRARTCTGFKALWPLLFLRWLVFLWLFCNRFSSHLQLGATRSAAGPS